MYSYSRIFRQRLNEQTTRIIEIDLNHKTPITNITNITGRKRKYEEAMGYPNDYTCVQKLNVVCCINVYRA